MTYLHKIKRPFIFAFLLFCVASSKHIIIYNEELLVLGTFYLFVIYIWTAFGNSIKDSIDESRKSILQELQSLAVHKKNGALHLKQIHEKVPQIYNSLSSIELYISTLTSQIGHIANVYLNRAIGQQMQLRCNIGQTSSQILFTSYQESMSNSFLAGILVLSQEKEKKGSKSVSSVEKAVKAAKKAIVLLQKR